jgi:transposase-like protein
VARQYAPEVKAAVLAALLAGQSVSAIAREHNVPRTTILGWKQRQTDPVFLAVESVATPKKTDLIPDLVLDLMIARLQSQIALAKHVSDPQWLKNQSADEIAILVGVQDDKLYRLLEALDRAQSRKSTAGS